MTSQCNVACALIGPAKCKTLIAGVYRPPDTSGYDSQLLIQHFTQINDAANVSIIVGIILCALIADKLVEFKSIHQ